MWTNWLQLLQDVLCLFTARTSRFFILSFLKSRNATIFICPCSGSPSQVSSVIMSAKAWTVFLFDYLLYHCKYPKYPVNICSFGLVFISSAFATLWPFGLKQVEGCAHQPLAVSPCFVFQRVMTSCTASPISQMLMRRRDDRNGTSWTSRLITAEWDSQALCGNSPQLTNTTRSLSWP